MRDRSLVLGLTFAVLAGGCDPEVPSINPFDPDTAPSNQSRAALIGQVNGADGSPLLGAEVDIDGPTAVPDLPMRTGQDGAFLFNDLTPGDYVVTVRHAIHQTQLHLVEIPPGSEVELQVNLEADLGESGIQGVAQLSGQTVHSGIVVEIVGTTVSTQTLRNGGFQLSVSAGVYDLLFRAPDHTDTVVEGVDVPPGTVVVLQSAAVLEPNPATLAGTVLLEGLSTGALAGAQVNVAGTGLSGVTAGDGSFAISGIPPGLYSLSVSRTDYVTQAVDGIQLPGGAVVTLAVPIELPRARGHIVGQVSLVDGDSDSLDNGGATLGLTGTGRVVVSADDGTFRFEAVATGTYELTASMPGFVRAVVGSVTVTGGNTVDVGLVNLAQLRGDFLIDGGSAYTIDPAVSLALDNATAVSVRVSEDPTFADPSLGDVAFVSYNAIRAFTLSTGDGQKTVFVEYQDTDAVVSGPFQAGIILDTTLPVLGSPALVISEGATATNASGGVVPVRLSATDATSGVGEMQISAAVDFAGATWKTFSTESVEVLADPTNDGSKTLYARFRDLAGNVSASASAVIVLDRVAPTTSAFVIDGGGAYTRQTQVALTITTADTDVVGMARSNQAGFPSLVFEPFAASSSWLLSPGDGTKVVYLILRDIAGNESGEFSASIELDGAPPAGVSVSIEGTITNSVLSTTLTGTAAVSVVVTASDATPLTLEVSEDPTFSGVTPAAFNSPVSLSLSVGDGPKRVYARIIDAAGNAVVGDASIVLDTTPPGLPAIDVLVTETATTSVDVALVADGAAEMRLRTDTVFDAEPWTGYARTTTVSLLAGDGSKTVTAVFRDLAGNVTAEVADTVILDTLAPTLPGITITGTIADGASSTTLTGLRNVTLSPTAAAAIEMQLSADPAFAGSAWQPFATGPIPWFLPATDTDHTVFARFRDAAGNISTTASAVITLDTTAPDAPVLVLGSNNDPTSTTTVAVSMTFAGAIEMRIAADGVLDTETWQGASASFSVNLPVGDGSKTVVAQVRDAAGNASLPSFSTLVLDTTAPTAEIVQVGDGSGYVRSTSVTVDVDCRDALSPAGTMSLELFDDLGVSLYSGPWQVRTAVILSPLQGARSIFARCTDAATNPGDSPAVAFTLDTDPPTVVEFTLNGGTPGELTSNPTVVAHINVVDGVSGSPVVALSETAIDCVSAAYVPTPVGDMNFTLSPGEGSRSLYLCARDAAGNVIPATLSTNAVVLDTTPPGIPSLVRTAISNIEISVGFSVPPDAVRFELERRVAGEGTFTLLDGTLTGTPSTYDDSMTTASLGKKHLYRIRAFDAVGNASGFSTELDAGIPIDPVAAVLLSTAADRIASWSRPAGTVLTSGTYSYEQNGSPFEEAIPVNARFFRLAAPDDRLEERIVLRNQNGDQSLTWESDFRFGNRREFATWVVGLGRYASLAVDKSGVAHIAYAVIPLGLEYLKLDGVSAPVLVDAAVKPIVSPSSVPHRTISLAIDGNDIPHIAYFDEVTDAIFHVKVDGVDTPSVVTAAGGDWVDLAIDSANVPHVVWYNRAVLDLEYLKIDGVSTIQVLEATGSVGRFATIAIDRSDVPHVAYYATDFIREVRYLKVDGVSTPLVVETGTGNFSGWTDIDIDPNDVPVVAYVFDDVGAEEQVLKYKRIDGVSSPVIVHSVAVPSASLTGGHSRWVSLDVDDGGEIHLVWQNRSDLAGNHAVEYFRIGDGIGPFVLDTPASAGNYADLVVSLAGQPHVTYWDGGTNNLVHMTLERAPRPILQDGPGLFGAASIALDSTGIAHVAYRESVRLRHLRLDSRSLPDVIDPGSNANGNELQLLIDSTDMPLVVYANTPGTDLWFVRGDGVSTPVLLDSALAYWPSAAITSDDVVHIGYRQGSRFAYRRTTATGGFVGFSFPDPADGLPKGFSVVADPLDGVHFAYQATNGVSPDTIRYTEAGQTPQELDAGPIYDGVKMVADSAGILHLLYRTDEGLVLRSLDGTGTRTVLPKTTTAASTGYDLAIDGAMVAHVFFCDAVTLNRRYLRADGLNDPVTFDAGSCGITLNSVDAVFDTGDVLHLTYIESGSLYYLRGSLSDPLVSVCADVDPPTQNCALQVQ